MSLKHSDDSDESNCDKQNNFESWLKTDTMYFVHPQLKNDK